MYTDFESLIYLFACASRGIEPDKKVEMNFEKLYKQAKEQGVWTVIYPLIAKMEKEKKIIVPEAYKDEIEQEYFRYYVFYSRRREFAKLLFEKLKENGIEFCILKGDSLAQYYAEPINRGSSDIDIKINPKDVNNCCTLLKELGYTVSPFLPGHHHFECTHSIGGLLEVHTGYCMDITENICFKNEVDFLEHYITENIETLGKVHVMGRTDAFIFLLMHYIKHFISTGAGIRQLMDIVLYFENNRNSVDMERVSSVVRGWGYEGFIDVLFTVGNKYLMSDIKCNKVSDDIVKLVIDDIENGGIFGYVDKNRVDFYSKYLQVRSQVTGISVTTKKRSLFKRIFPDKKELEQKYKYLENSVLLYPVAVVNRLVSIALAKKIYYNMRKQANELKIESRLQMLEKIGLI